MKEQRRTEDIYTAGALVTRHLRPTQADRVDMEVGEEQERAVVSRESDRDARRRDITGQPRPLPGPAESWGPLTRGI